RSRYPTEGRGVGTGRLPLGCAVGVAVTFPQRVIFSNDDDQPAKCGPPSKAEGPASEVLPIKVEIGGPEWPIEGEPITTGPSNGGYGFLLTAKHTNSSDSPLRFIKTFPTGKPSSKPDIFIGPRTGRPSPSTSSPGPTRGAQGPS